jgi:hypothetical protein
VRALNYVYTWFDRLVKAVCELVSGVVATREKFQSIFWVNTPVFLQSNTIVSFNKLGIMYVSDIL